MLTLLRDDDTSVIVQIDDTAVIESFLLQNVSVSWRVLCSRAPSSQNPRRSCEASRNRGKPARHRRGDHPSVIRTNASQHAAPLTIDRPREDRANLRQAAA